PELFATWCRLLCLTVLSRFSGRYLRLIRLRSWLLSLPSSCARYMEFALILQSGHRLRPEDAPWLSQQQSTPAPGLLPSRRTEVQLPSLTIRQSLPDSLPSQQKWLLFF